MGIAPFYTFIRNDVKSISAREIRTVCAQASYSLSVLCSRNPAVSTVNRFVRSARAHADRAVGVIPSSPFHDRPPPACRPESARGARPHEVYATNSSSSASPTMPTTKRTSFAPA